jgi:hypothetical protein
LTSSLTDLDFFWVAKKERREREERIWGWDSVERETLEKNIWWVERSGGALDSAKKTR